MKLSKSIITKAKNGHIITVGDETVVMEGDVNKLSRQYREKTHLICKNERVEGLEILYYRSGRFYLKPDCKGEYKSQRPEFWKYALVS